ncbi:MAG: nitroreductase family protein [Rhodocyclaceae bacterium]|nr:nitroreductase family protein [Rhodocyclaceae bacterium]
MNMTVSQAIQARRSVRSYRDGELDRPTIQSLLDAAVRAPTAVHEEPWAFVVVQDRQTLRRLSDRAKPLFAEEMRHAGVVRAGHSFDVFSSPEFNVFYDAGTLIVICAKPVGPFVAADCWLAAENLMLAACAMGLGTCVIGSAVAALNIPETKTELGIPADYAAVAPLIVGYPRGETPASSRREPVVLAWR